MNFFQRVKEIFSGKPKADYEAVPKKIIDAASELPAWPSYRGVRYPKTRRVYKRRPQLFVRDGVINKIDGTPISYRAARMHRIAESQRQGVEIARQRREEYVKRRSAKWKKIVTSELPKMFAQAMEAQGLGFMVGSGKSVDMKPFDMTAPGDIEAMVKS
jgi:hypothetical protein